jgi:hypothetical protein
MSSWGRTLRFVPAGVISARSGRPLSLGRQDVEAGEVTPVGVVSGGLEASVHALTEAPPR